MNTTKGKSAGDAQGPKDNHPISSGKERGELWAQRYALISKQPFFEGLTPNQLESLTDDALEVEFEAGQQIFREGGPANRFYLILEGKVLLESEVAYGVSVPLQTLGPGDELGWSWLIPPYTLQFGAKAVTRARALFFYGTRLRERCEQDHDLGYRLMRRIAEIVVQRLQAARSRMLENPA